MRRDNRPGFTLIELLVVISIITILAALLLPAIRTVKELAQQVRCGSHLRQIHLAALAYGEDNTGELPPSMIDQQAIGANNVLWLGLLSSYLDASNNDSDTYQQVLMASAIWGCPKWKKDPAYPTSCGYGMNIWPTRAASTSLLQTNYQLNGQATSTYGNYRRFTWSMISSASRRPMFGDSTYWKLTGTQEFRHQDRLSLVFGDGHVGAETWTRTRALTTDPTTP